MSRTSPALASDSELSEERIEQIKASLPDSDDEPLETPWHRSAMNLLIDSTRCRRRGQTNYFVGGNMFIHWHREHARVSEFRGPDFFLVKDVDGTKERKYWWVFDEHGRYPTVIVEFLSATTAVIDRTTKKDLYETVFQTPEYFCYDPDEQKLEGWRLVNGEYVSIEPNEHGWLWSEELELWLGAWEGSYLEEKSCWLRFYDTEGVLVPTAQKKEQQLTQVEKQRAKRQKQRAERERLRADTEKQRAETEKQRAEAEKQLAKAEMKRADVKRHRGDRLEAEVERLKALLAGKAPP